jgi:penicillin-binding protein 1A
MDEYMDAWFIGFTPSLVAGVWVGYDVKKTIGAGMTGARAALPAWTDFMIGATRGQPVENFSAPTGTVTRLVCAESGMLATDHCPNVVTQTFTEGSEPREVCTRHPGRPLETPPAATPIETEAPRTVFDPQAVKPQDPRAAKPTEAPTPH